MTGIEDAALLAVVATASALGASALPRASWPRRSPAAAILLWQALGLAAGLATVGTLIGLALPSSQGGLVRSVLHAAAPLRRRARPERHVRPWLRFRHRLWLRLWLRFWLWLRRGAGDPGRGPAGLPGRRPGPARLAVLGAPRRL